MTRNEARQYFRDKGLTYADVCRTDLALLSSIINRNFAREREAARKAGEDPYWLRVNSARNYKGNFNPFTGSMVSAFLTGKGGYFTAREVVSFCWDGWIGFCGDSDDKNAQPVLEAFVEWCDEMAAQKEMTKEVSL